MCVSHAVRQLPKFLDCFLKVRFDDFEARNKPDISIYIISGCEIGSVLWIWLEIYNKGLLERQRLRPEMTRHSNGPVFNRQSKSFLVQSHLSIYGAYIAGSLH